MRIIKQRGALAASRVLCLTASVELFSTPTGSLRLLLLLQQQFLVFVRKTLNANINYCWYIICNILGMYHIHTCTSYQSYYYGGAYI